MITNNINKKPVDSDSSDDEDNAQIRQFLEATDQTLLTNDMFSNDCSARTQKATEDESVSSIATPGANRVQERPKSERYLNEDKGEDSSFNDLQISKQMQLHIWRKLSAIIESQVKFCKPEKLPGGAEKEKPINKVKLFTDAKCYVIDDIPEEPIHQKKPIIKRRRVDAEPDDEPCWGAIAVSGESILDGKDMECWGSQRARDRRKESRLLEIIKS